MKKKILLVVSGTDVIEAEKRRTGNLLTMVAHPYEAFKKRGYDIDVHNIKGGVAPVEKGGVVSAVCHGRVSLINVKLKDGSYLVDGKKVTGFSIAEEMNYAKDDVPFELEDALKEHGGDYGCTSPWQTYSIADGRLVTGQHPVSAQGVAEKVIAIPEA